MGEDEEAISQAFYVKSNSRLGCQNSITKILEGLELELAQGKLKKASHVNALF
jgi:2Fe-2S ferredoxin